jgi:hypothetical protein
MGDERAALSVGDKADSRTDVRSRYVMKDTGNDLTDEPMCVGEAVGIDGRELLAWVIPSVTWRGRPRFEPKVERHFVTWSTSWRGRRRRSFEQARDAALKVLHRLDRNGGRGG